MKCSTLKAEITVPVVPKTLALLLAILDPMYSGDQHKLIKMLVKYYGVVIQ